MGVRLLLGTLVNLLDDDDLLSSLTSREDDSDLAGLVDYGTQKEKGQVLFFIPRGVLKGSRSMASVNGMGNGDCRGMLDWTVCVV